MATILKNWVNNIKSGTAETYWSYAIIVLIPIALYISSIKNYLLFHSLAEIPTIIIGFIIFVIFWNSRKFLNNNYLLFLGVSFFFVSIIDLLHTLSYKGMGIFVVSDMTNHATQLWLAARYVQSISLLLAPIFLQWKKFKTKTVLFSYAAVTALIIFSIFYWDIFPTAYIEGSGLTPFKKASEYIISAILTASLIGLIKRKDFIQKNVAMLFGAGTILAIFSELSFIHYVNVYGFFNMFGHLLKIASFYFFYRAFIVTSFKNPYALILKSLKQKEDDLNRSMKLLENSEERFRSLATSASDAIISTNTKGNILTWNKGAEKIFGYESKETIGKPIKLIMPERYADSHQKGMERLSAGGKPRILGTVVELEGLRKNGEEFPIELSTSTWKVDGEIFYGAIIRDVTKRRLNEEIIRQSRENYRDLVDNALVGVYKTNLKGGYISANRTMAEIFEFSLMQDLLKENAAEIYKNPKQMWDVIEKLKKNRKIDVFEFEGITKTGKIKNILTMMSLSKDDEVLGIIIDTTEKKKAEKKLEFYMQKLEKEKAESEALLSNIEDGVIAINTEGKIFFANKGIEKLCGVKVKEIINKELDDVLPFLNEKNEKVPKEFRPGYAVLNQKNKISVVATGKFYFFNKLRNKNIPLSINATPIMVKSKIIGSVVFWKDASGAEELERAKNEFISFTSHQLRTPLTSISLSIETLLNYLKDKATKEQKKYLKIAQGGTREMTDLIEMLLNVSRIEMGTLRTRMEITNIADFTDKILNDFSMQIKDKKISLKKTYNYSPAPFKTDRRLIKLAIENLVSNAIKYSPEKNPILVEIKKNGADEALIAVSDAGYGVPKEQQTKIFDKLFRVHTNDGIKGTGLGLYIAKSAVEEIGGKIWCQSPSRRAFFEKKKYDKKQKGATFFVAVPLKEKEEKAK